jgi:uncharacterized membrane protein YdfJ with MMPL/SSD domain
VAGGFTKKLEAKLEGQPENILRMGLLAVAAILVLIALFGSPIAKAVVLAWVVLP